MAKVVMIWGSPGSGKSLFSCVLAAELASENKRVMVFSPDQNVPMLPVFLAGQKIETGTSIASLFQAHDMSASLLANAVHVLPQNPMIGVLGFSNDEIPWDSLWPGSVRINEMLKAAGEMTDFILWDCTSDLSCCINTAMLEIADLAIRIITPDLKGIHYFGQMERCMANMKQVSINFITLAGMARAYHAIDELSYLTGGLNGVLPFSKEMERCVIEGNFFNAISHCHTKYLQAVETVANILTSLQEKDKVV